MSAVFTVTQRLRALVRTLVGLMLLICLSAVVSLALAQHQARDVRQTLAPAQEATLTVLYDATRVQGSLGVSPFTGVDPIVSTQAQEAEDRIRADLDRLDDFAPAGDTPFADLRTRHREAVERWLVNADRSRAGVGADAVADSLADQEQFAAMAQANRELAEHLSAARDGSRAGTATLLQVSIWVVLATTVIAIAVATRMGDRVSRSLTAPLHHLRQVMTSHGRGGQRDSAVENEGALEVRLLAREFNELSQANALLKEDQEHVVTMHRMAMDVAMALRESRSMQEALDATCQVVGLGIGADRVMLSAAGADGLWQRGSQWCQPHLEPTADFPPELQAMTARIAVELWRDIGVYPVTDLYSQDLVDPGRARMMADALPARAALVVPVGLGSRVIGLITALMVDQTREWTPAEINALQQVSAYCARTVLEREYVDQQQRFVTELQRLDKQKSDFMATISHELRTPLTSISGYVELLADEDFGPLADEQEHALSVVSRNTRRLRGLIDDLLVLNRIDSAGLKNSTRPVDLAEALNRVRESLAPLAATAGVNLGSPRPHGEAVVLGDGDQLERALTNVVGNAIKFTPPQGTVQLDLRTEGCTVEILCRDSGIGIPAEDQNQMFTRFFRASNARDKSIPGTGLGLVIVKAIVESHDGNLDITSTEGQGTSVTIRLPLAAQHQAAPV